MILLRAREIPPDLLEFFEPVDTAPPDVQSPSPSPFSGAHYATFPPDLVRPLLLASAPLKACPVCGAGYAPVVDRESHTTPVDGRHGQVGHNGQPPQQSGWFWTEPEINVLGYRPTCEHDASPIGGLVLDPFAGSGTVLAVARELGLRAVGVDLSASYLREQAAVRACKRTPAGALDALPLFATVGSVTE